MSHTSDDHHNVATTKETQEMMIIFEKLYDDIKGINTRINRMTVCQEEELNNYKNAHGIAELTKLYNQMDNIRLLDRILKEIVV